jgi:hypothetical protein
MTSITVAKLGVLAFLGAFVEPCAPSATAQGALEQVASLHTPRSVHTATTLKSGQVLIVGGMASGGESLASVELFDPSGNTVEELRSLADRRAGHTATLLSDGRVLIAGGYNGDYLRSVEIFDPATQTLRQAGSLIEGRSGHTATLLPDGRVLFVGGVGRGWTFLRSAELYDPSASRSELVGNMNEPRESHTATLLADERVLIIGGHSGRRQSLKVYASAEVFSPPTRRFVSTGTMRTARHKHDAVLLADGRVLVIGGADRSDRVYFNSTEIYTPGSASFQPGPSMANSRYKIAGTSVVLSNGDVLVTSGSRTPETLVVRTGLFHAASRSFPAAYLFAAAALLPGGDVLVTGGYSDDNRDTDGIWRLRARE